MLTTETAAFLSVGTHRAEPEMCGHLPFLSSRSVAYLQVLQHWHKATICAAIHVRCYGEVTNINLFGGSDQKAKREREREPLQHQCDGGHLVGSDAAKWLGLWV